MGRGTGGGYAADPTEQGGVGGGWGGIDGEVAAAGGDGDGGLPGSSGARRPSGGQEPRRHNCLVWFFRREVRRPAFSSTSRREGSLLRLLRPPYRHLRPSGEKDCIFLFLFFFSRFFYSSRVFLQLFVKTHILVALTCLCSEFFDLQRATGSLSER